MGRQRNAQEAGDRSKGERTRLEIEQQRRDLELAEAELNARIQTFQLELEVKRAALRLLELEQTRQQGEVSSQAQNLPTSNDADLDALGTRSDGIQTSSDNVLNQES